MSRTLGLNDILCLLQDSKIYKITGQKILFSCECYRVSRYLTMISSFQRLDEGVVDILFVMLGISACVQLWIPCYLGTLLRNKVRISEGILRVGNRVLPSGPFRKLLLKYSEVLTVNISIEGNDYEFQGFAIGDSCFNSGWNETPLGQLIRADILFIIFRSQIPIYIKFTGLPNIQLETFSSVSS